MKQKKNVNIWSYADRVNDIVKLGLCTTLIIWDLGSK